MQIGRRVIQDNESIDIASVFTHSGIPGHIFVEGDIPDVLRAVHGLVTVLTHVHHPVLIPLAHRDVLLRPRNPISRPIQVGSWVRCTNGLYRNDLGFVCEHDETREGDMTVALVPRIPEKRAGLENGREQVDLSNEDGQLFKWRQSGDGRTSGESQRKNMTFGAKGTFLA